MIIFFNPYYDNGVYAKMDSSKQFGTTYMGIKGLLDELKLRAGFTRKEYSAFERVASYREAMKSSLVVGSMFYNSFNVDANGTAESLLQWRDSLIMAGVDLNKSCSNAKVDELVAIEKEFKAKVPGDADDWLQLSKNVHKIYFPDQTKLHVRCSNVGLPNLIKSILKGLSPEVNNCNVINEHYEAVDFNGGSVELINVSQLDSASKWLIENYDHIEREDAVVVCSNVNTLNNRLLRNGRKLVEEHKSNLHQPITQLFKLVCLLLCKPLDVYILQDFLRINGPLAVNSLQQKKYSSNVTIFNAGKILLDKLGDCGIGEKWNKQIDKWLNPCKSLSADEATNYKAAYERYDKYLNSILSAAKPDNELIDINQLKEIIKSYSKWLGEELKKTLLPVDRSQYLQLQQMFNDLQLQLRNSDISTKDLLILMTSIYQPVSEHIAEQLGGLRVVPNVSCLSDIPSHIIWLGCQSTDDAVNYNYSFLSNAEIASFGIAKESDIIDAHLKEVKSILAQAKKVTLLYAERDGSERLEEHPIVSELKQSLKPAVWNPCTSGIPVSCTNLGTHDKYVIDKIALSAALAKYKVTSFSAIENLITTPFNFVCSYLLNLKEPQELYSTTTIMGNVAHLVVQKLINKAIENTGKAENKILIEFERIYNSDYETLFDEAINEKGTMYLLPSKSLEKDMFRMSLKDNISALITIMKNNDLAPWESEAEYPKGGSFISVAGGRLQLKAHIDMIAKIKGKEDYWIFDFKYSSSENKYKGKLGMNKSMQLELYRQAANAGGLKIVGAGYFLFKNNKFYYNFGKLGNEEYAMHVDHKPDAIKNLAVTISDAVKIRLEELENGIIEEGELMNISSLPVNDPVPSNEDVLKLIEHDSSDEKIKASGYPSLSSGKSKQEKTDKLENIGTSNSVLKGRLK